MAWHSWVVICKPLLSSKVLLDEGDVEVGGCLVQIPQAMPEGMGQFFELLEKHVITDDVPGAIKRRPLRALNLSLQREALPALVDRKGDTSDARDGAHRPNYKRGPVKRRHALSWSRRIP